MRKKPIIGFRKNYISGPTSTTTEESTLTCLEEKIIDQIKEANEEKVNERKIELMYNDKEGEKFFKKAVKNVAQKLGLTEYSKNDKFYNTPTYHLVCTNEDYQHIFTETYKHPTKPISLEGLFAFYSFGFWDGEDSNDDPLCCYRSHLKYRDDINGKNGLEEEIK